MREHPLRPCTEQTAFWAIAVHDSATHTVYHLALVDLLSGHTLWSQTSHRPIDRAELEDAARTYRGYGWRVEAIPA